jgi:septum formation protein
MLQADAPPLILASASTARRAVLAGAGLHFAVRPAAIDEAAIKHRAQAEGLDARAAALRLADAKATWVARQEPHALVIGADQILICGGKWYDKPEDLAAARRQLQALRNRTHELATAVVCHTGDRFLWQHVAQPRLTMRAFSETFLDAYLAVEGGRVLGSVGAYRLEGPGVQLFACVVGDHAAILGLPLLPLLEFLRSVGLVLS